MPKNSILSGRRLWILAGVGAFVLLVAFVALMRRPAPATVARDGASAPASNVSSDTEYVNDRLRREIATQGLTVDRARQLFAVEVTSLPGVMMPQGQVRPTLSGTYALTQLQAVRAQLTAEQRARLDELLDAKRSVFPQDFSKLTQPFSRPRFSLPAIRPAVYQPGRMTILRRVALPDVDAENEAAYRAYFQQLYDWANDAVAKLTGRPQIPAFLISFEPLDKGWVLSGTWKDGARRTTVVNGVTVNACLTRIDVRKFEPGIDVHLSVVTHEVVHCFQQLASASADDVTSTHPWLHDGQATWAQMVIVPGAALEALRKHWTEYLMAPEQHLFNRSYDAAGFFGHVADVRGADVVGQRLIPTFVAGSSFRNDAAYNTMVAGAEDRVLDTWAPGYFRSHESVQSPVPWTVTGPGGVNLPSQKLSPVAQSVSSGETIDLHAAAPWELSLVSLDSTADIVVVSSGDGHVAVVDRSEKVNEVLAVHEPLVMCLRGDCTCPTDTEGAVPPSRPAQSPIDIGLTGGRPGAFAWAHGMKLEDYCDPKKQTYAPSGKLPQPPSGGDGGGSEPVNGTLKSDPHLVTFDGRWYDMQALGEFTLARSTMDDFVVQVRLGTIGALRTVSVATAMATQVGRDRVTVTIDNIAASPVPVLRINGARANQDFVPLAGGSVRSVFNEAGTGYITEFNDGTRVGISPFARQGLNVWVVPAAVRKGLLTGLLGDSNGSDANEPVVRGTADVLPAEPEHDDLYGKFANSWRITAAESLFDYASGQSPATFADANFPARVPVADAVTLVAAQTACRESGISNANLLKNCSTDFAASGNRSFIRAYQPQQRRIDLAEARGLPLRGTGVVTPNLASIRTTGGVFDGRVPDANADAFESFPGYKGDVVYLDPANCLKPRFMQILGPDKKTVGGLGPQCGLRLVLPSDGNYSVALNPFHDFTGLYHLAFVPVRPDRITKITAGDILTGTLSTRADHDVFLLDARGPGAITIGGSDCTADFDIQVYFGDDETIAAGPACRMGQVTLPKPGTYRVVINPFNAATGPYHVPTR